MLSLGTNQQTAIRVVKQSPIPWEALCSKKPVLLTMTSNLCYSFCLYATHNELIPHRKWQINTTIFPTWLVGHGWQQRWATPRFDDDPPQSRRFGPGLELALRAERWSLASWRERVQGRAKPPPPAACSSARVVLLHALIGVIHQAVAPVPVWFIPHRGDLRSFIAWGHWD